MELTLSTALHVNCPTPPISISEAPCQLLRLILFQNSLQFPLSGMIFCSQNLYHEDKVISQLEFLLFLQDGKQEEIITTVAKSGEHSVVILSISDVDSHCGICLHFRVGNDWLSFNEKAFCFAVFSLCVLLISLIYLCQNSVTCSYVMRIFQGLF